MILFVLAYLGGVLTIVSPCILPVLPFARSERPFASSGLPMLAGMVLTFAAVATLAAIGGGWAVQANAYGRIAAIATGLVRRHTAVPGVGGSVDPTPRRSGLASVRDRGPAFRERRLRRSAVATARRCDGPAVGALRRSDPRLDPDGSGPAWSEYQYIAVARDLCGGRGDVARPGLADRRQGLRRDEAMARRRRMDKTRLGRGGALRGGRHRAGSRYELSYARFTREHGAPRTGPGRQVSSRHPSAAPDGRRAGGDDRQASEDAGTGGGAGRRSARRRPTALAVGGGRLAELAAADAARTQGQGRRCRFLDLLLHQLPARNPVCPGLGRKIQRRGACRDWRAHPGICLREKYRQCEESSRGLADQLPGRD